VIEVNIHPAQTWDELVVNITSLYEDARQTRLGTEKFMLDGNMRALAVATMWSSAGQPPLTAAVTPADLLRSLVGYWHNHPAAVVSLSGLFIGPTSQHHVSMKAATTTCTSWRSPFSRCQSGASVHRGWWTGSFATLLVDVTGNTHRAEFCIDKLYSLIVARASRAP